MKNKYVKKIKFTALEKLNKEVTRTQITSPANIFEICPEMHALAKMAEMAINRQIRQTINKNSKRWQRGPLQSGDFGENGVFGENGRNGA